MTAPSKKSDEWSRGLNAWGKVMIPLVVVVGIGVMVAADLSTDRERRIRGQSEVLDDLVNLVTRSHPISSQAAYVTAWVLIVVFVALILGGSQFAFTKESTATTASDRQPPWHPPAGAPPSDAPVHGVAPTDRPVYGQPPTGRH